MKTLLVALSLLFPVAVHADVFSDLADEHDTSARLQPSLDTEFARASSLVNRIVERIRKADARVETLPDSDDRKSVARINVRLYRERYDEADTTRCEASAGRMTGDTYYDLSQNIDHLFGQRLIDAREANAWYRGTLGAIRNVSDVMIELDYRLNTLDLYLE